MSTIERRERKLSQRDRDKGIRCSSVVVPDGWTYSELEREIAWEDANTEVK